MKIGIRHVRVVCDVVIRLLGVLLIVAAILKGWQLVAEPPERDGFGGVVYIGFIIFQICFELLMGTWLISGVFKRLAVRVATVCFAIFFCVQIYNVWSGAEGCGCFGAVDVPPMVTLLAVDLPALIVLILFGVLPEADTVA